MAKVGMAAAGMFIQVPRRLAAHCIMAYHLLQYNQLRLPLFTPRIKGGHLVVGNQEWYLPGLLMGQGVEDHAENPYCTEKEGMARDKYKVYKY